MKLIRYYLIKLGPQYQSLKIKNIIDCKRIFTVQNDELGKPLKYKARVVASGYSQEYLTDYN